MIRELHTYEIECDHCGETAQFTAHHEREVPDGWKATAVSTCDMGCCFRDEHRCPACVGPTSEEDAA